MGMPGSENPKPGVNYRIAITWGPSIQISGEENFLEHVQLRVVFEGWKIGDQLKYQDALQFYTNEAFTHPAAPKNRAYLEYPVTTVFQPYFADVEDYAYFRVTTERERAWKMVYNIGIYGAVHQGTWKHVTAR
jgi:hypothetical protein